MLNTIPDARYDAKDPSGGDNLGDLPEWNLDDLYPGEDSVEIRADLDWLKAETDSFAADYENKLNDIDAAGFLNCIQRYEVIEGKMGRIMSYAGLRYYQNTTDADRAKFMSDMQGAVTDLSNPLVFYTLEINRMDDAKLAAMIAQNTDLARYKPILDRLRAMRPYQLSDELEKFLHDKSVVGTAAWNRLFDETMAGLTFDVEGEETSLEATLNLLSDSDRSRREVGARALTKVFTKNLPLFARITNTLAKEKEITDKWRNLPTAQMSRHLSNHVEPEVVQALRDAVVAAYPKLSHRYYALKAKWMGLDKLEIWDRNAPLPDDDDIKIGWNEARDIVLDAYAAFDPKLA
ncbi:MAG: oligoendopeptidase F, partial [Rhodobacteraceae bacterium]|nr:oligoendopeptidase F [Paracoccaceae bacterium]